jgi:hypothetical protein
VTVCSEPGEGSEFELTLPAPNDGRPALPAASDVTRVHSVSGPVVSGPVVPGPVVPGPVVSGTVSEHEQGSATR